MTEEIIIINELDIEVIVLTIDKMKEGIQKENVRIKKKKSKGLKRMIKKHLMVVN